MYICQWQYQAFLFQYAIRKSQYVFSSQSQASFLSSWHGTAYWVIPNICRVSPSSAGVLCLLYNFVLRNPLLTALHLEPLNMRVFNYTQQHGVIQGLGKHSKHVGQLQGVGDRTNVAVLNHRLMLRAGLEVWENKTEHSHHRFFFPSAHIHLSTCN